MNDKATLRATTNDLVARYLAAGNEIKVAPDRATCGYTSHDWKRITQGLKVATGEEIAEERHRRALIAVGNKDADLVMDLLAGRYDKEIKHDLENDRLGPNGEIR